jgi:hypothetical protein
MPEQVKMTATRQVNGDHGLASPGDHILLSKEDAEHYEANGLALRGHVKLTDGKIEKANEAKAETEQALTDEIQQKAVAEAPENKAAGPSANKSTAKK